MKTHSRLLSLVHYSKTFLVSTIDERNFPMTKAVSAPLRKEGLQRLTFYIDGLSETADNVRKNCQGSVFCFDDCEYESLLLSGDFELLSFAEADYKKECLSVYQQSLVYEKPALLQFTTIFAKAHLDKETKRFIF